MNIKKLCLVTFIKSIPLFFTDGLQERYGLTDLIILLVAGFFRHTAGYCWGYNQKLYFSQKFGEDVKRFLNTGGNSILLSQSFF